MRYNVAFWCYNTDLFLHICTRQIYMTKFVNTFWTKCSPYTTFSYLAAPPVFSRQNSTGSIAASKFDCTIGFREKKNEYDNNQVDMNARLCVRERVYLVEERNRYTVTRGIVDNSVKCGLIYTICPNLNPEGLHIRAWCCETIRCK